MTVGVGDGEGGSSIVVLSGLVFRLKQDARPRYGVLGVIYFSVITTWKIRARSALQFLNLPHNSCLSG